MKTLDLAQNINNTVKRAAAYYPLLSRTSLRSAGSYLVDAAAEGVKQNFLGPNINMEFLTLSIKVYFLFLLSLGGTPLKHSAANHFSANQNRAEDNPPASDLKYCIS